MAGLVVRREQMQAFEQALLTTFVNRMADRLRVRFPAETGKLAPPTWRPRSATASPPPRATAFGTRRTWRATWSSW